ncbi:hypothetical protein IJO12_07425 [bacterium]|nr:hypothetical protein [bacterium]
MNISKIGLIRQNNIYYQDKKDKHKPPRFQAHPDFDKLAKYFNITASSYFRRGPFYGEPSAEYVDVVKIFDKIFKNPGNFPKKMLIVGIGNSQEPFSYLATIQDVRQDVNLNKILDLHIVDLQSKPKRQKLFYDSYYGYNKKPPYAQSSFVFDKTTYTVETSDSKYPTYEKTCCYRVNNDIFDYLNTTYENPKKSLWDTRIQDAVKNYEDEGFDIISMNNTLYYIYNKFELDTTVENIYRILKKDAILISDPYYADNDGFNSEDLFKKIGYGIYMKK